MVSRPASAGSSPPSRGPIPAAGRASGLMSLVAVVAASAGIAYPLIHGPRIIDTHAAGVGLAAGYFGALSVAAPVVVRRLIPRFSGAARSTARPAVGPPGRASTPPAARLGLVTVISTVAVSLAGAALGTSLARGVDMGTHVHAVGVFVSAVNAIMLAGTLVFAAVHACGTTDWPLARTPHALGGPPRATKTPARMDSVTGSTRLAVQGPEWRSALVEFLCEHAAGEVAVPAEDRARPEEAVFLHAAASFDAGGVSIVEADGRIVGVVGPRERVAAAMSRADTRSIMVPISSVVVLEARSSAAQLLPELARHGFALVAGPTGLSYVTPAVLGHVVGAWVRQQRAG